MHATYVIKRPLITEKATWESQRHNRVSFAVDRRATKTQVRRAVQQLYDVKVEKVLTQIRKGEHFRNRFGYGKKSDWKKAVVVLAEGDQIDLF